MSVYIEVTTMPLGKSDEGKSIVIDHANPDDRRWLAKHCWWAMRSGHQVTTKPVEEA